MKNVGKQAKMGKKDCSLYTLFFKLFYKREYQKSINKYLQNKAKFA